MIYVNKSNGNKVEAIKYSREKNINDIIDFVESDKLSYNAKDNEYYLYSDTGFKVKLQNGDYVVKTKSGIYYKCKNEVFEKTFVKRCSNE